MCSRCDATHSSPRLSLAVVLRPLLWMLMIISIVGALMCMIGAVQHALKIGGNANPFGDLRERSTPPPNPDTMMSLRAGCLQEDNVPNDTEFCPCDGRITSINMYLQDGDEEEEEQRAENVGEFLTLRINGRAFIERMSLESLPSKMNIDLSEICSEIPEVNSRDAITLEFSSEENAHRSATVGIGIHRS